MQDATHATPPVPQENLETYTLLYYIEVSLRELLIERFRALNGYAWYKKRLPGDILGKYKAGRAKEKAVVWTNFVHHDPLYYVDFPELSKILGTGSNWQDGFAELLGNKEVFLGSLKSLEEIRNKIAHNRKATTSDVRITKSVFDHLINCLGSGYIETLVERCASTANAESTIQGLRDEARHCFELSKQSQRLPERRSWNATRQSPWLGMLTIDHDFEPVESYFGLLDDIDALPRSWPAYKVDRWRANKSFEASCDRADDVLSQMLDEVRNGEY